jgi:hypothetical protein
MHALMRIPHHDTEPYRALTNLLRQLPPFVKVEVDPDRIV